MRIESIPLLDDNYAWLLIDEASGDCAVVDPSQTRPVLDRVQSEGLTLRWILNTHHHWDHIGGNQGLIEGAVDIDVICSTYDFKAGRVPGSTRGLSDCERFTVAGSEGICMEVPGHTLGAVSYFFPADEAVFTGDTLFTGGCGRLFEGSPEQMYESLLKPAGLPPRTRIFCGHEYTEKNLRYSQSLHPDSPAISARLEDVRCLRGDGKPTVPATLDVELKTNPFLLAGSASEFTEARRGRDQF